MYEPTPLEITPEDREIVNAAISLIRRRGEQRRHHIAAALKTTNGQQFLGLHISANIGATSICAEAAAIAEALKHGPMTIDRIVAVRHTFNSMENIEIVSPCGRCRELIYEYGPNACVILSDASISFLLPIADLLPFPFHRRLLAQRISSYPNLKREGSSDEKHPNSIL